jgi:hypothetical protein
VSRALIWGLPVLLLAGAMSAPAHAQEGPTIPNLPDVNKALLAIVAADQWDRGMDMFTGRQVKSPETLDWPQIHTRDAERKAAVRRLLQSGEIQSGREYQFAALVFQHSTETSDLSTAHVLAATAVAKGNPLARWLAAATFDRLLWSLDRPQVFGTQFKQESQTQRWTMEPYDSASLPDAARAAWCVVALSEQQRILKGLQSGSGGPSTSVVECK